MDDAVEGKGSWSWNHCQVLGFVSITVPFYQDAVQEGNGGWLVRTSPQQRA
jgi:hypothetical protein